MPILESDIRFISVAFPDANDEDAFCLSHGNGTLREMVLIINGNEREFSTLAPGAKLAELIALLGLKGDRVAVEHNGAIATRAEWGSADLAEKDNLEIVHFVGGGAR